jgi:hypothetical protein
MMPIWLAVILVWLAFSVGAGFALWWAHTHTPTCDRMHCDPTHGHIAATLPDGRPYEYGRGFHMGPRFPRPTIHKAGDGWVVTRNPLTNPGAGDVYDTFDEAVAAATRTTEPTVGWGFKIGVGR